MSGFEPRTSDVEATALPTEQQPLPAASIFQMQTYLHQESFGLWKVSCIKSRTCFHLLHQQLLLARLGSLPRRDALVLQRDEALSHSPDQQHSPQRHDEGEGKPLAPARKLRPSGVEFFQNDLSRQYLKDGLWREHSEGSDHVIGPWWPSLKKRFGH